LSHELRTPLNSLLILARLLADNVGGNLNTNEVQFAQTIYASGMDLLSLINDLLDLAKIESGALTTVNVAPGRLDELREDFERSFRQSRRARACNSPFPSTRAAAAGQYRHGAPQAGAEEPARQCVQVHQAGGVSLAIAPARSGWTPGHGRLDAARSVIAFSVADTGIASTRQAEEHLRGISTGRRHDEPAIRRHRPRAVDQP